MNISSTPFEGLYIIEPKVFGDHRGYFMETYRDDAWETLIEHPYRWIQENEAYSHKGILRGLHYQLQPYTQAKLVRVIKGSVQDVVVDLRHDQPTYGQYYSTLLSDKNKRQLLVPHGFAHGYLTLEQDTIFVYKCDRYYAPQAEASIDPLDKKLGIPWEYSDNLILSEKDQNAPRFQDHKPYTL